MLANQTRLLRVPLHVFVPQIRIHLDDMVRCPFGQHRRRLASCILNVFLDKGYTQQLLLLSPRAAACSRLSIRDADVKKRIEFLEWAGLA
jgi:hypothetical protein